MHLFLEMSQHSHQPGSSVLLCPFYKCGRVPEKSNWSQWSAHYWLLGINTGVFLSSKPYEVNNQPSSKVNVNCFHDLSDLQFAQRLACHVFLQGEVEYHADTIGGVSIAVNVVFNQSSLNCHVFGHSLNVVFNHHQIFMFFCTFSYHTSKGDCDPDSEHDHCSLHVRLRAGQVTAPSFFKLLDQFF